MIIIIGASASGKTEVVKKLIKEYGYKKLVTYTTREKRIGEIDGIDYNFISLDAFNKLVQNDEFFETVKYNNNYYGTLKKDIGISKVLILDPSGFKKYNNSIYKPIISFFLYSSKKMREERMIKRGDRIDTIKERLENDSIIFSCENIEGVNYIINSDALTISEIAKEINDLYKREC